MIDFFVLTAERPKVTGFVMGVLAVLLVALAEWVDPGFLKVGLGGAGFLCFIGGAQTGKEGFPWLMGALGIGFVWWFFWPVLRTLV